MQITAEEMWITVTGPDRKKRRVLLTKAQVLGMRMFEMALNGNDRVMKQVQAQIDPPVQRVEASGPDGAPLYRLNFPRSFNGVGRAPTNGSAKRSS